MTEQHSTLPVPRITPAPHLLLVVAPYYRVIANDLVAGAIAALEQAHATHEIVKVPGALEIPPAIRLASRARRHDGFVALGCVLRGETTHYETVCNDSSRGLMLLGLEGLCIGNGILTCETMDQARVRAATAQAGGQDKGGGAAGAALHLIALSRRYRAPAPGPANAPADAPGEAEMLLAGPAGPNRTA